MSTKHLTRREFLRAAALTSVGMVAAACAPSAPTVAPATATAIPSPTAVPRLTPTAGPRYGGVLRLADAADGASIGYPPQLITWGQRQVCPAIETLLQIDGSGQPIPWLASNYTSDVSAKTITLTLQKGVKFHDGTDFNADAVKWNLETYATAKTAGTNKFKSVDSVDATTVRINLTDWDNTVVTGLTQLTGMMISPTAFKQNGQDWALTHPVGTGPFQLVSWQKDVKTTYKKFEAYWQPGRPYLDGIEWTPITDPVTRELTLRKGDVDLVLSLDPKAMSALQKDGFIVGGHRVGSGARSLVPDSANSKSPFADIRVRQAAQYAIDNQAIVDTILAGGGEGVNQYGYKGHWGYNDSVVGYPYNPTKAKQLLVEAGYANGFKTKLAYSNATQPLELWPAVQAYLKAVGIDADLDSAPATRWQQMALQAGGWEGLILAGAQTTPDLAAALSLRFTGGGQFYTQMILPDDYLKAVRDAIAAPTFEAKQKSTQDAIKLMVDKYAMLITLYSQTEPVVSARYVKNHGFMETPDTTMYSPSEAWLDKV